MSERHDVGKKFSGKIRIQLFAKSFILQVCDVLARHTVPVPTFRYRVRQYICCNATKGVNQERNLCLRGSFPRRLYRENGDHIDAGLCRLFRSRHLDWNHDFCIFPPFQSASRARSEKAWLSPAVGQVPSSTHFGGIPRSPNACIASPDARSAETPRLASFCHIILIATLT
jgi:hypothetical protein